MSEASLGISMGSKILSGASGLWNVSGSLMYMEVSLGFRVFQGISGALHTIETPLVSS